MKRSLRVVSILLALIMVIGLLPANFLGAISEAFADDSPYNLTIDFDYAENNNVTSASDALRVAAENGYSDSEVNQEEWQRIYDTYNWQHVYQWTNYSSSDGSLRKYLESTDAENDTYIVLSGDDTHSYYKTDLYSTIKVTTDKVLDLNGHTLEINYSSNRKNDSTDQTTHAEYHNCIAIEINKGATLTIIDSSAWRGEGPDGKGTGTIWFNGYMIDPYDHDINYYTTRDLFWVNDGNLVIYGGTFKAGRKKDQLKSNFSLSKLKSVIGTAVEMGVNVAEYATGLNTAVAKYHDLLKQTVDTSALNEVVDTGEDDGKDSATQTVIPRDGTNQNAKKDTAKNTPEVKDGRDQTVGEKKTEKDANIESGKPGTKEGENKSNDKKNAKDDTQTKLAESENNIVNQALNKDKISGIVDSAFSLVEGIAGLFGNDENSRVTNSIKGTVVHVGSEGSFVAYGGTFMGYGSTPNTRNGVIEVDIAPGTFKEFDHSKYQGGLAYIYGGTFEAYNGANVFNMVRANKTQYSMQYVEDKYGNRTGPTRVAIPLQETNGVEVIYFENQEALSAGEDVTPIPVNTANVQVRGGTFRCFYDLVNVGLKAEGDDQHFTKFPGTMGSINLGVESFNSDLIQDGRIQLIDRYGDGALVLLDERSDEQAGDEGLYHYRLFCGDTELRYKSYLEVYPNTAKTNSTHSMQLATYVGTGKRTSLIFTNDDEEDNKNIRAPYRQTENYFDYMIDAGTASNWSVMPNFHFQESDSQQAKMDVYGESLANSEIWYYPLPLDAGGIPIEDVALGEAQMTYVKKGESTRTFVRQPDVSDSEWNQIVNSTASEGSVKYYAKANESIRTNLMYFTYKIYRVDPLTRENISESSTYGVDEPLITVRYGTSLDSLKCKLPLKTVEREIKDRRPEWQGYQAGEMYRITLSIEEYVCMDYCGYGLFGAELPAAKTETSILFRCFTYDEQENTESAYLAHDYTPVQWMQDSVEAGKKATVNIVNGKAGMTDYIGDVKVFDIYYQWWEVKEDGTPIRLIAGTDNIYDEANGDREDHRPESWNVSYDGKIYVNTVDPDDPLASTYGSNGLPASTRNWKNYQLHFYGAGTVSKEELTKDGTDDLHLGNNKIFAFNTDTCYIPEDMAGKYLKVKVIAQNLGWPEAYDEYQTFWSHTVQVKETVNPIKGDLSAAYSSGKSYGTYDNPVTLSLENVRGLASGETITSVYYWAGGVSKEITDLSISDTSNIPSVRFPNDFYKDGYNLQKINGKDRMAYAMITTSKGRQYYTSVIRFSYEVESKSIVRLGNEIKEYKYSDVQSGRYSEGHYTFLVTPDNATVGFSFADYTTTNTDIVTLDEKGYIHFGGEAGEATITVNSPDGTTVPLTVRVVKTIDKLEVSGLKAPTIGQILPTSVEIPDGANYHVKEVFWTIDSKRDKLSSGAKAENYHSYTVNVVVEPNDCCKLASSVEFPFTIAAELADGTIDVVSAEKANLDWHCYWDDDCCVLRYKFNASVGGASSVIDKIYMDFPTEVYEGENVSEWLKQVHIYTNGDDTDFEFTALPTYDTYALEIAETYGDLVIGNDGEFNVFVPGVQSGLMGNIFIPYSLDVDFPSNSKDISVIINGENIGTVYYKTDHYITVSAYDSLEVLPGAQPSPMPEYSYKPLNLVAGTTVHVEDLVECDDPGVRVKLTKVHYNYDLTGYLDYDLNAGTITPIQTLPSHSGSLSDNGIAVDLSLEYDENGDGVAEFSPDILYRGLIIYSSASEIPATPSSDPYHVTVLDPEGYELYTIDVPSDHGYISIPEVDNAFVSYITDEEYDGSQENVWDSTHLPLYGTSRLYMKWVHAGDHLTVHTVSADDLTITVGSSELYAFVKDENGDSFATLSLSVDGEHFVEYDHLIGLEPNTEYTVYYRQGNNGKIYAKAVRTANCDYGVRVGRSIVTDANLGNLERDGWHYDPDTQVLTLKDINLRDPGAEATSGMFLSITLRMRAAIVSNKALTINLIGDNYVEMVVVTDLVSSYFYAEEDLTIEGNGNITLPRNGDVNYGFTSNTGDIYLNGTGTQTFEKMGFAYKAPEGKVYYSNGTIEFISRTTSSGYMLNGLVPDGEVDNLIFSGKVHSLTISVGDINGNYTTVTEDGLREQIKYNANTMMGDEKGHVRIVPNHSDTRRVASAEYLKSGSCDRACTYYYSCACGHLSDKTFTQSARSHELIHHDASPATCISEGWDEYDTCANCGYTTFQSIPAFGHDWVHYDEKQPTCEEDGHPAYDECSRCGASSRLVIPASTSLLRSVINPDVLRWKATGHDYFYVSGTAPTCTTTGTADHYECVHCGGIAYDGNGALPMTEADLAVQALGHNWSPWTLTKEPTAAEAGEMTRICDRCGEIETKTLERELYATLYAASLTFEGKIAINFKLTVPDEDWKAILSFEKENGSFEQVRTVSIDSAVWNESEGRYVISYTDVASKQMTNRLRIEVWDDIDDPVKIQIGAGKDDYREYFDYCVADWANNKIEKSSNSNEVAFAKAILNYGGTAQDYFGYKLSDYANPKGYMASEMKAVTADSAYNAVVPDAAKTAGLKAASLVFESATEINVKFSKNASVKVDGKAVTLSKYDSSTWMTTIENLPAKKLHELHTIDLGGATAKYGALSWANNKIGKTGTEQAKKDDSISRALYLYNRYARLYFKYDTAGLK